MRRMIMAVVAAAGLAMPAAAQSGEGAQALLARADANSDGAVSRAEAAASRQAMFVQLDANGDGYIEASERSGRGGEGAERLVARADENGDGRIAHAELMGQPYLFFTLFDRDNDDVLDAEELAAARTRLANRRTRRARE